MSIDAVTPATLQPLGFQTLAGALTHGQTVVGRVVQVLSETVARISVFGHTIEVATPGPLEAGVSLKLQVQNDGQGLRFQALPLDDEAATKTIAENPASTAGAATALISSALAGAQTAILTALITNEAAPQGRHTTIGNLAQTPSPETQPQTPAAPLPLSRTFELPIILPQGQTMVRFQVKREPDEPQRDRNRPAPISSPPAWSVQFSLDAEPLGPVHAKVRLANGAIGVKVWAQRQQIAQSFQLALQDLRDALSASELTVDELLIIHTPPDNARSQNMGTPS